MRLLTILLIFCCAQGVAASGYSQHVTLVCKNERIESVLKKMEKQTGYSFFYNDQLLRNAEKVTFSAKNEPFQEILSQMLSPNKLQYTIEGKIVIIAKSKEDVLGTSSRSVRSIPEKNTELKTPNEMALAAITGVVKDEFGNPVVGASVMVEGTKRGTSTNASGAFTIDAEPGQTLLITAVGYESQQIKIGSNTALSITLKQSVQEEEELLINSGIFKKADKSFTGASVTVTAAELSLYGNRNLLTSLRNFDPSFNIIESSIYGSNPNRLPEIQIRGNGSVPNIGDLQDETRAALNVPLVVVDGFQSSLQTMYDMNENEVESITILKDAAATAMYGSRGSNGVVVITTKGPKEGKLRVTLNSTVTLEVPDLSQYDLLNARDKLQLEYLAGNYNKEGAGADLAMKRYYNYLLNEVNRGVETDWLAIPLRNGVGQRHNLRIEGGDKQFRYSASAMFNDIQGVMKENWRRTFNGTINLAYTYKTIKFSNKTTLTEGKSSESPYGAFSDYVKLNAYWSPYDSLGNVNKVLGNPGAKSDSYFGGYTQYWSLGFPTNPLYNATLNTFDTRNTSIIENQTTIDWNLTPALTARGQFSISKNTGQSDRFRPADHTKFNDYTAADVFRKGDYLYGISNGMSYDGSLNLQYSKMFAKKHLVTAGADYNIRQDKISAYSFLAEGFPNPNFDFPSMALQYAKSQKPTGSESLVRAVGILANANYIYDGRYFVDASYRLDGSSQFGANKRFAPFWSVGAGWNIHNEKMMSGFSKINRLKLRGSVGVTGSQQFAAYQAFSTYQYYTNDRYFSWLGSYLMGLGNPNLKWQQKTKYNIGVDMEFFNRRLLVTADYYTETTNGLVSSVTLPASSGFTSYTDNIGSVRNRGFELKVTGVLINNDNITWSITPSALQNRNKVLKISQALKDAQDAILNDNANVGTLYYEGYSYNTIWVVPSLGIDPSTGKELYLGKDGLPTYTWSAANIVASGNRDPDLRGNFSTLVRYKSFSLNLSFRYTYGAQQYNQTLVDRVEVNNYRYNVDSRVFYSRWKQPGDIAAFKGIYVIDPTYKTSRFVQDENTFILQNVDLQYNVTNKRFLSKTKLQALNITANTSELAYWSTIRKERSLMDPYSRQFSLTLNATF